MSSQAEKKRLRNKADYRKRIGDVAMQKSFEGELKMLMEKKPELTENVQINDNEPKEPSTDQKRQKLSRTTNTISDSKSVVNSASIELSYEIAHENRAGSSVEHIKTTTLKLEDNTEEKMVEVHTRFASHVCFLRVIIFFSTIQSFFSTKIKFFTRAIHLTHPHTH